RRNLVLTLLYGRIGPVREHPLRLVTLAASFGQRRHRIWTERQQLLFAREPVLQPPELAAVYLNDEVQAAAVRQLKRPFLGLGLSDRKISQGHWGVSLRGSLLIPLRIPPNSCISTSCHESLCRR